ncbi:MAG: hypothetical protein JNL60_03645 [Bacteroidia bacterium]|nr:hypothetical protein [Bacteroidia bacterium]
MKKLLLLPLVLGLLIGSCKKKKEDTKAETVPDCSGGTPSFASAVSPLIASSCAGNGCHASGSGNGPGALTNYTQIKNAAAGIRSAVLAGTMPQGSTLTNAQKSTIVCWIDAGTPNN